MRFESRKGVRWLSLSAAFVLLIAGCGQTENRAEKEAPAKKDKPAAQAESKHNYKGRDWCAEHGVPESTCSMCSAKAAAECKKKGDWCDKHDRALSQCFLCNPKLKDKFAAEYRAQYGEDPPPDGRRDPLGQPIGAGRVRDGYFVTDAAGTAHPLPSVLD